MALSTASVFPDRAPDAFEAAARLGYDGVEVMVSADAVSQDVDVLRRLGGLPRRSRAGRARALPADHPAGLGPRALGQAGPGQGGGREAGRAGRRGAPAVPLAARLRQGFRAGPGADGARRPTSSSRWRTCTRCGPGARRWRRTRRTGTRCLMDCPHVTLDLSHTAVSGSDALAMAEELGGRLAHVHMADGTGVTNRDEHLVPGRGTQPCAPLLEKLAAMGTPAPSCSRSTPGARPRRGQAGRPGRGSGVHPQAPGRPARPVTGLLRPAGTRPGQRGARRGRGRGQPGGGIRPARERLARGRPA